MIHVRRETERDLAASLTALPRYRQTRWRAVILYGMAGIGKTALARALADDDQVKKAFRDGVAWVDGSQNQEEEVMRLCLGFDLEREPGERWHECWRRWAGTAKRRLLLIIDDAVSSEGLAPLIAGLGPQAVALITTQPGTEIRAEVERWLPAEAVMEVGMHGLLPAEGRALVEAVAARSLSDVEWALVQEIGELVGWHPEALRLAAIEGREIGWAGMLDELRAGRMPWEQIKRQVNRQWARLDPDQQAWLAALIERKAPEMGFTIDEAAQCWKTETATARQRLWKLERCGQVAEEENAEIASLQWRLELVARLALTEIVQRHENRGNERQ